MSRYDSLFRRLERQGDGAFIPFLMLGDPTPETSAALLVAALDAGADALELGLPFSDPVADGPVIQEAANRALAAGVSMADCRTLIAAARAHAPEVPIGLLVYANLVVRHGTVAFYRAAAAAGVDSVLIADVPADEAGPFADAALAAGVEPVLIVAPNADAARISRIAALSRGYTYVTTRSGVTGDDGRADEGLPARLATIRDAGAAPPVLGFGISTPAQVTAAIAAGAAGAIAGSAIVRRAAEPAGDPRRAADRVAEMVRGMKAATVGARRPGIASNGATADL